MRSLFLLLITVSVSNGCLKTRNFNECGCIDYKLLSMNQIRLLNPELADRFKDGILTIPRFSYPNCTNIEIECARGAGDKRTLLRTNWPEGGMIYRVDMDSYPKVSLLWFDVECDRKTHEWRYTVVDNDQNIVTEHVVCHAF
uniref:Candidate secreted effector protein n=2 Tax=Caenorhabditis tropicalis TaxID=1561998 RepID=A0A1I7TU38_9PELO